MGLKNKTNLKRKQQREEKDAMKGSKEKKWRRKGGARLGFGGVVEVGASSHMAHWAGMGTRDDAPQMEGRLGGAQWHRQQALFSLLGHFFTERSAKTDQMSGSHERLPGNY